MQQFYANGLAMPSKMDWKEERSFIVPSAARGTVSADNPPIWERFLAFCKPFFRKWVHKLKIWGHLFRTRVPLLEKRDPFLKRGVPFLPLCDTLSAKRIPVFRKCDYILEKCVSFFAKCVPLLEKRDSILGRSDRTFITSEQYAATCVPLSEKRDPILGERDHTFITSEQYFATCDPLLVKCDPYFATCVSMSAKRTTVLQKRDIQISKRVHGKSICVPKKASFSIISSRKSLQASDLITTLDRECTVSVRGVYWKGTGEVLERYWRPTKDPLNACTSGVDQRYSKRVEAVKNKVTLCLTGLLCFMLFNLSTAWAQSADSRTAEGQTEIKPLKIGDTIPEELWRLPLQVVNHPDGKDTITLSDYRDKKLIILDFWST